MPEQKHKLKTNKQTWDAIAPQFYGHSALPNWDIFGAGTDDSSLIGSIRRRTFLELCCGSGHSIQYLTRRGAKKVYGVDVSETQIAYARQVNRAAIEAGRVVLFEAPMEKRLPVRSAVDTAFSIYGVGWAIDPTRVFKNVYSYLKPGGRFIWSWDHTIFRNAEYQQGKLVIKLPYHVEKEMLRHKWRGIGNVYTTYRKTATWFRLLRESGFHVVRYLEPPPIRIPARSKDTTQYYSIHKARMLPATIIFVCEKPRTQ